MEKTQRNGIVCMTEICEDITEMWPKVFTASSDYWPPRYAYIQEDIKTRPETFWSHPFMVSWKRYLGTYHGIKHMYLSRKSRKTISRFGFLCLKLSISAKERNQTKKGSSELASSDHLAKCILMYGFSTAITFPFPAFCKRLKKSDYLKSRGSFLVC